MPVNILIKSANTRPNSQSWLLWTILPAIIFASCEQIVEPDLERTDPVPVVDAWLTTDGPESVNTQLSWSIAYNANGSFPPIAAADVRLMLNDTAEWRLGETLPGVYRPNRPIPFAPGGRYRLQVSFETYQLSAQATMPPPLTIDSIRATPAPNQAGQDQAYHLIAYFQDPPLAENYYLWRAFRNGQSAHPNTLQLFDDQQIDGVYVAYELPIDFAQGDTINFCLYQLTAHAYRYYQTLKQITETSSSSIIVPQNPNTNLQGGALGYFTVAPSDCQTLLIAP